MSDHLLRMHLSDRAVTMRAGQSDTGMRTISGQVVPFGVPVDRFGVTFTFEKGSLRLRGDTADVKLLMQHDPDRPVGYATSLTETDTGWEGTFALPDLPQSQAAADEVEQLLRDGLSVGAAMSEEFYEEFTSAMWASKPPESPLVFSGDLVETSVVSIPQFPTARATHHQTPALVHMTRQETPMDPTATTSPDAPPQGPPAGSSVALADRLDQVEARLLAAVREPDPTPVDVAAAFTRAVTAYGEDSSRRQLQFADMVSSNNTGLTSTERTTQQIIDYLDTERYFLNQVARMPFPETGIVHTLPEKINRSQVGTAAEKAPAPSAAISTGTAQFTGAWYKGWLDISYELIRTSSPGAVAVAVDDMLGQAALHSEQTFIAAVEAAATASGAVIDFSTYGAFIKSVRGAVRTIRTVAGKGATPKFALTPDSWDELLAFVDANDRRLLATTGPMNADGTAGLTADVVTLAGLTFFESPHSGVDVGYNDNSLMASELPPLQLSADNPQLVGRDVAILGNIMAVTRVPAGIVSFEA